MRIVCLTLDDCKVVEGNQRKIRCKAGYSSALCWKRGALLPLPHMVTVLTPALQEFPTFHTMDGRKVVENLEEFDDAREVVAALSAEYEACERPRLHRARAGGPRRCRACGAPHGRCRCSHPPGSVIPVACCDMLLCSA